MAGKGGHIRLWAIWGVFSLALAAAGISTMAFGGPRQLFLIGDTTDAHHQIELACDSCHTSAFGGREAIEEACHSCHQDELDVSDDSHPRRKFTDPRNADRLAVLDATKCLTCHIEHDPEVTSAMAVTLPIDFCSACHQDIAEERPSHDGYGFETCASAGCHNFHDNRGIYEDFLAQHLGDPDILDSGRRALAAWSPVVSVSTLPASSPDAPRAFLSDALMVNDALAASHAQAGVNCSGCHQPQGARASDEATWIESPGLVQCHSCHAEEARTFTQGRHGMRLAEGRTSGGLFGLFPAQALGPMSPERSRLPMKADAHGTDLECATCHAAHEFEPVQAQVEPCLTCHNDDHTRAYQESEHFRLWQAEVAGLAPEGSGVSCATCHMPRLEERGPDGVMRTFANHNQNDNLRPNEKMLRSVCLDCHGMGFSLDALADAPLIARNFNGTPSVHVESLDWVERRLRERGEAPGS